MRKLIVILIIVAVSVSVVATATSRHALAQGTLGTHDDLKVTDAEIAAAKTGLGSSVVGILACTLETEYHSTVANGAAAQLSQYGLKAEVFDSQVKADQQINAIESYVAKGAKVLVICDFDPKTIDKAVKDAAAAGARRMQCAESYAASGW